MTPKCCLITLPLVLLSTHSTPSTKSSDIDSKTSPVNAQTKSCVDVLIIGAGASGLYCAMTAAQRGRSVLVLDHANKAGKKILMSGGGRCNFTNYVVEPEEFYRRQQPLL